ncbi:hypothetical protein [Oceanicola sp. 22II-s10i]|uniref:hypothetical protein n=1 Tax=Oceanicola sp. 22II-s10i TaxID=1317116 RepID=UPI00113281B2|nr:hypothetical protein [Oceanicola sp. 22II-s10i]
MAQRFVPPKGALIMMVAGILITVGATYLPRNFNYGVIVSLIGGVMALVGVAWHMVARFRWRMDRARR